MRSNQPAVEEWVLRLKRAYDIGYYKTEAALDGQESFPWQNKTCKDCPFWLPTQWCQVQGQNRVGAEHTCLYFDEPYHLAARHIIQERQRSTQRRFWGGAAGNP